jgi:adenylate cyclase, class 2
VFIKVTVIKSSPDFIRIIKLVFLHKIMNHVNIEIKAKCSNQDKIREILKSKKADFKGLDHQIDTYFKVNNGRLKIREGNIEKSLIHYTREDKKDMKQSNVILYPYTNPKLKQILEKSFGILCIVDKSREIFFIDNVKFHIDNVKGLGTFVEIEAISSDGKIKIDKLNEQCEYYKKLFDIKDEDLIAISYSDLLIKKN